MTLWCHDCPLLVKLDDAYCLPHKCPSSPQDPPWHAVYLLLRGGSSLDGADLARKKQSNNLQCGQPGHAPQQQGGDNVEDYQPSTTIGHTKGGRKKWWQRGRQQSVLEDDGRGARMVVNNGLIQFSFLHTPQFFLAHNLSSCPLPSAHFSPLIICHVLHLHHYPTTPPSPCTPSYPPPPHFHPPPSPAMPLLHY